MSDCMYEKVKAGLQAGMRWNELKKTYGCGSGMLTKARKELGLVRKAKMTTEEDRKEIMRLIAEGMEIPKIAKQFGVDRTTVFRISRNNGVYKYQTNRKHWFVDWIADKEHLLDDRTELMEAIEQHLGKKITREWLANVLFRLGYTSRSKMPISEFRAAVEAGLKLDSTGLPSYGDKADKELFEQLEVDGEPEEWIVQAYEAWLEARKQAIISKREICDDERSECGEDFGPDFGDGECPYR